MALNGKSGTRPGGCGELRLDARAGAALLGALTCFAAFAHVQRSVTRMTEAKQVGQDARDEYRSRAVSTDVISLHYAHLMRVESRRALTAVLLSLNESPVEIRLCKRDGVREKPDRRGGALLTTYTKKQNPHLELARYKDVRVSAKRCRVALRRASLSAPVAQITELDGPATHVALRFGRKVLPGGPRGSERRGAELSSLTSQFLNERFCWPGVLSFSLRRGAGGRSLESFLRNAWLRIGLRPWVIVVKELVRMSECSWPAG